jgi:hypothetical protein
MMINELIKLASHLDTKGYAKESDYLDGMIKKYGDILDRKDRTRVEPRRFQDVGMVGGRWGHAASGMLVTDGSRVLLLKRGFKVLDPRLWGIPGGAIPVDRETGDSKGAEESAFDEAIEEMGSLPAGSIVGKYVFSGSGNFTYTTFIWETSPEALERFRPQLNWEHTDWMIEKIEAISGPAIHPGVIWVLDKIKKSSEEGL